MKVEDLNNFNLGPTQIISEIWDEYPTKYLFFLPTKSDKLPLTC